MYQPGTVYQPGTANRAGRPPADTPEVPRAVTWSWPLSTEMDGGAPAGAPGATATALFAVLGEALPVRLVCAVAEGWAQESQDQLAR